ncbi:hypothetical protein BH10PLA2_BH10PLA2_18720 [soil metagenome]
MVFCMAATILRPRSPDDWGAGMVLVPLLAFGAAVGAIIGVVLAIRRISLRAGTLWPPRVWIGMALGIALGLALYFFSALSASSTLGGLFRYWPVTVVLTVALGMLGGIIGKLAAIPWDHQSPPTRRKRKRKHRPD